LTTLLPKFAGFVSWNTVYIHSEQNNDEHHSHFTIMYNSHIYEKEEEKEKRDRENMCLEV